MQKVIPIEVSARHVHLTKHDLEVLFGESYELKRARDLSQPGQFVSTDEIILVGSKNKLEHVRVLGPCRVHTQIEVSRTDSVNLGITTPLRLTGKIIGSGAVKLVGPKGELELKEGLIVAKRHLNIDPVAAKNLGLAAGQNIAVEIEGPRALIFKEVEVCLVEESDPVIYLDADEANAAGISTNGGEGRIIKSK